MALQDRIDALLRMSENCPGVTSLVVFGSTARSGAARRDAWSDIDFNLFVTADQAGADAKTRWPFLPDPNQLVLTAREGENGGVALYEDGLICEFGAGLPWTIRDPDHEVLLDGGDLEFGQPPPLPEARDQLGLFVVKLLIGYGRIQRGEVVSGNGHLRNLAVMALAEVLRQVLLPAVARSPFDPLRRLELALPEVAGQLAALQVEESRVCALGLLDLAEHELADRVPEFPHHAFAVARASVERSVIV